MNKLSQNQRRRWKKTSALLCLVLVFILLTAVFLRGQSPAMAESLDKEDPSAVSRVLVIGEGNPVNDQRKEEIEKEQKEIQEKREEKRQEESGKDSEESSQDTSPKGTASDKGKSGIGGGTGGEEGPPGDNDGEEPESPDPGGVDPSKLPVIICDLQSVEPYTGPTVSFEVQAYDYQKRPIERVNFKVYGNDGEKIYSTGTQYNGIYQMELLEGTNKASITVTDTFGVSATKEYIFTGDPDGERVAKGQVYVTLDMRTIGAGDGNFTFSDYPVTRYEGENMPYVVIRALEENGYSVGYTGKPAYGFYLKSIKKPGLLSLKQNCITPPPILKKLEEINASEMKFNTDDALVEKEIYEGSGWIYLHEGEFFDKQGMSSRVAKEGDHITIAFTTYYGAEYNGDWFYPWQW